MGDDMAHRPIETCLLIEDARKIVEEKLIDNIRYLSRNELASYVKWPDVEKAVTMMRDILPPDVFDESLCKECHYILATHSITDLVKGQKLLAQGSNKVD